jgi:hypothetical protein
MLRDVMREITRARANEPAGNFLAALGLLCYTEAIGEYVPDVGTGSRQRFDAFFVGMGPAYAAYASAANPYKTFRCGMAHAYLVSGKCQISMLDGVAPPQPCGVGLDTATGWLWFNVETYYKDFVRAADALYRHHAGHRHPNAHNWGVQL